LNRQEKYYEYIYNDLINDTLIDDKNREYVMPHTVYLEQKSLLTYIMEIYHIDDEELADDISDRYLDWTHDELDQKGYKYD
jgi:hypothetical protein